MNSFCMNCGIELPEGASFCPKCGAKVEAPHCPSCGKKVDFGADFCIYCGHPLTGREEGASTPAESPELNPPPETLNTPPAPVQPVSEIPPVLVQPAKEVPRGDDVQEFSWSYFKLGFTNFSNHRHNITATLTKEKLHIAEQRRWGWKPKTEETDIALVDITELCIRSKASAPYWVLYSALATACLFAIYAGVLDAATCVILALVVGVSIWIASFNLLHNEFVILTRDNKKTVLKGAKEAVFQQLEQEISSRTEVRIGEAQSAALTIFISISVGIIATGAVLLLLGGRTAMPTIAKDDLIGRWDLQYMENDGEIYSYDFLLAQGYTTNEINLFFHSVYIQFFEDGFFELTAAYEDETPEQVYGTWAIKGSRIVIVSDSTTVEGYLHDGLLCMESEDSTMRFEHVSSVPTKPLDRFDEPNYTSYGPSASADSSDNWLPSAAIQPSNDISEPLFSQMPSTFYFMSGTGGWATTLQLNADGSFTGSFIDDDMGDTDSERYPNGTSYMCYFSGVFATPQKVDDYTYSTQLRSLDYMDPGMESLENGIRNVTTTPYGLEAAYEITICLPGYPVENLSDEVMDWLRMTEFYENTPERLPFYMLINENEQFPFFSYQE